jgi:hypothetical protein
MNLIDAGEQRFRAAHGRFTGHLADLLSAKSKLVELLLGVYAQYFNRRHERKGHLYQERFRARVIRDEPHLREAMGYVYANPVRAGPCATVYDWPWSGRAPSPMTSPSPWTCPKRACPPRSQGQPPCPGDCPRGMARRNVS